ncbi:MAG: hypothetical protein H0V18_03500, partial [Pyrinomonadaceae bacterium]|nr:hypothetical protein [Pyrinomonadaceae bacterium]
MMKFLLFTAMTPLAGGLIKLNARDRSRTAGNQNMSKEEKSPLAVAENIWVIKYPLTLLGLEFGRTVTLVRLASGEMVIHSTAPFTASDIAAIRRVGEPAWLLDATLFHDSFAQEGQRAFSELPYLAPQGFSKVSAVNTSPLVPAPAEWVGELDVLPLAGMPKCREHLFFHRPSRTLIVCDCLFNFGKMPSKWTRFFLRNVMRLRDGIGMSAFFRFLIRD